MVWGFVLALGVGVASQSVAAEPTTNPLLRVEAGMHTTMIRRLVVDAPRNRLITASDDKTVRVWQMPEARLVSVLRVPMDQGHEGQLFGLAVSPDGRTVAAAGWTGWDWDGTMSVYLFDTLSGEITGRIGGFRDGAAALAFTPDGKHLIVGLQARAGLHVVRIADRQVVASDTQYNDKIMDLHALADGRVLAVALDGMVRLYAADFHLAGRRVLSGGKKPSSVRLSPDSKLVAVGFIDQPTVAVLNASDLSPAFTVDTSAVRDQISFDALAWSSDGRHLYAGGEYRGSGLSPLYRWGHQGRGASERFPLVRDRITDIQQMPGNVTAFSAEDPGVGLVGPDGKRIAWRSAEVADFRNLGDRLSISADGATIRYPLNVDGGKAGLQTFSVNEGGDQLTAREPKEATLAPLAKAAEIRVDNWRHHAKPTVNGVAVQLDDYELAHCYAIAHDHKSVLLGTEWALRLLDGKAVPLWQVKLPAVVRGVNIAKGGKLAIAALSDGTIRWFRMSDGREVLALFPHAGGKEWIAWSPDGYYVSSVFGDNYVGWHLNRGRDATPDFFRAVQFDRILYRPDIVQESFRAALLPGTRGLANTGNADFKISRLREIAPPRMHVRQARIETPSEGTPRLQLQIDVEKNVLPISDYSVFVNNLPVTLARERNLTGKEVNRFTRSISVALPAHENTIRVEAFNGVSMGVAETFVALPNTAPVTHESGNLLLLAIGANEFPNLPQRNWLAFAARDAQEFASALQAQENSVFRQVRTRVLADTADEKPTRAAILAALEFLSEAQPADTVMIFLASHGVSDPAGNYYFVPRDAQLADIKAVGRGDNAKSLLPWTTFFDALRGLPGRRVLIVDTCQAKNIEGKFEAHSLIKRSASSQFALVMASRGNEESQEYPEGRHGLFTYALIDALRSESDNNHDQLISLREMFLAASPLVERLRSKSIGPQTPQFIAPDPLGDLPLLRVKSPR